MATKTQHNNSYKSQNHILTMGIVASMAEVAGYCRVRQGGVGPTQEEVDIGRKSGIGRPATQDQCSSYVFSPSLPHVLEETRRYMKSERKA